MDGTQILLLPWFPAKKHLRKPMQYGVARLVYVPSCRQCSVSHVVCMYLQYGSQTLELKLIKKILYF